MRQPGSDGGAVVRIIGCGLQVVDVRGHVGWGARVDHPAAETGNVRLDAGALPVLGRDHLILWRIGPHGGCVVIAGRFIGDGRFTTYVDGIDELRVGTHRIEILGVVLGG